MMGTAPIEQIDGDPMWGHNVAGAADERVATVGGEYHSRGHGSLEESVQIRETFNVKHVNLRHAIGC